LSLEKPAREFCLEQQQATRGHEANDIDLKANPGIGKGIQTEIPAVAGTTRWIWPWKEGSGWADGRLKAGVNSRHAGSDTDRRRD
jgi:hypothetical protein